MVVRVRLVAFNEPIPMEKVEEGGRRKDKGGKRKEYVGGEK